MIKLKICDDKRYIIQMLPAFKRGGGKTLFKSPFGNVYSSMFPDSYDTGVYVWGKETKLDYNVVEVDDSLKRDLKIFELWAESINERFVICLS